MGDKMSNEIIEKLEEIENKIIEQRDFHSTTERCHLENRECSVMCGYQDMLSKVQELIEIVKGVEEISKIEKGCGKEFQKTWQNSVPKANLFICGKDILCPDCNDLLEEAQKLR